MSVEGNSKPILDVLNARTPKRRPIWMMRQAGRYLPEYREVRKQAGSFLQLCYNPELACEVTLQPLRRFDLDAAIVFADILLIPQALGVDLRFETNEGPKLEPVRGQSDLDKLSCDGDLDKLEKIFATLRLVSGELGDHIGLIGFCGAPWTVASYMVEGGTSPDRALTRQAASQHEPWFDRLIEILTDVSVDYLEQQVKAGAEILQIFDTWAGDLSPRLRQRYCFEPIRAMVDKLRQRGIDVPIIGFARGVGEYHTAFAQYCQVNAIGVEWQVSLSELIGRLPENIAVQGNIDPVCLMAGGDALDQAVSDLTRTLPAKRHILNLGHGIRQQTPIFHVEQMIEIARKDETL